jgi:glycosyltransferase involved in cell wall biosynthesis
MKILIVADNISMKMGGEASLPFYYFKLFRDQDVDVHCVCHARVRDEIQLAFSSEECTRFTFIEDTPQQSAIFKFSQDFPPRLRFVFGQVIYFSTMSRARTICKKIIGQKDIDLVFEPAPITPKGLSFMYGLEVPVVIGPLCGGIDFPPAFAYMDSPTTRITFQLARLFSTFCHRIIPGKLQANALVVANQRTEDVLPIGMQGKIYHVVESGVDLAIWKPNTKIEKGSHEAIQFVFAGSFIDWKGIRFLVEAFVKIAKKTSAVLHLVGDGELRATIENQVRQAEIQDQVRFHGWMPREQSYHIIKQCDVFVMPSLRECGGTAILEAMAIGLPVIVTNWCGPAQYVTPECGFLIDPSSHEVFVSGLAGAMSALAESPDLRRAMGEAGQKRVKTEYFDWNSKANRMLEIFGEVMKPSVVE